MEKKISKSMDSTVYIGKDKQNTNKRVEDRSSDTRITTTLSPNYRSHFHADFSSEPFLTRLFIFCLLQRSSSDGVLYIW